MKYFQQCWIETKQTDFHSILTLPFPIRAGGMRASIDIFSKDLDTAKKYLVAHMRCVELVITLGIHNQSYIFQGLERKSIKAGKT